MPIRRDPNFADSGGFTPEGSCFCQFEGSLKTDLGKSKISFYERKLRDPNTYVNFCIGNMIMKNFGLKSETDFFWKHLETQYSKSTAWNPKLILFGRVGALRVLVGLAQAIRRQIGNTELGGCNSRQFEKNTAFKFCLFSAALNSRSSFFRNQVNYFPTDQWQRTYNFFKRIKLVDNN